MIELLKRLAAFLFLSWGFLVFITAMILVFPFILLTSVLFKDKKAQDIIFFFLRVWAKAFSVLCYFPVKTIGGTNLKRNKAYIYVCNHNSYLDAIAVLQAIKGSFKPLGKIEMVKTPIFGIIYRRVVVLIDRKNIESRARSVEDLKYNLNLGQSILIFPEGTMNQGDEPLAEFYDGAFRLSIETQTPIVPMVILNARKLLPRKNPMAIHPGIINCVLAEPFEVNGIVERDLQKLKESVYNCMKDIIQNPPS